MSFVTRTLFYEVLRFGLVGTIGFTVDVAVLVFLTKGYSWNPFGARMISFLTAATLTWCLHRTFTFRRTESAASRIRVRVQWARFIVINGFVAVASLGLYSSLIIFSPSPLNDPVVSTTVSAIFAAFFNFGSSKFLIFNHRSSG